jgi:CheY-like chemotaxis protein
MKKTILWIEEEGKIELIHYKTPLVRGGYSVDIASDATDAVQLLREKKYGVIVFDLIIPCGTGFDTGDYYVGYELLRRLAAGEISGIEPYPPSRLMVFTAVNDPEVREKIRKLGVETILNKRLNELPDLKNCVDKLFEEKAQERNETQ